MRTKMPVPQEALLQRRDGFIDEQHSPLLISQNVFVALGLTEQSIPLLPRLWQVVNLFSSYPSRGLAICARNLLAKPCLGFFDRDTTPGCAINETLLMLDTGTRLAKERRDADLVCRNHHLQALSRARRRDLARHLGRAAQSTENALFVGLIVCLVLLVEPLLKTVQVVDVREQLR